MPRLILDTHQGVFARSSPQQCLDRSLFYSYLCPFFVGLSHNSLVTLCDMQFSMRTC